MKNLDYKWAKEVKYDKNVFWPIFERHARDTKYETFNVVADYNYSRLSSAIDSGMEFLTKVNARRMIAQLKAKYQTAQPKRKEIKFNPEHILSCDEYGELQTRLTGLERHDQELLYSGDDSSAKADLRYYRGLIRDVKEKMKNHRVAEKASTKQNKKNKFEECAGTACQIVFDYPNWGTEHVADMYATFKETGEKALFSIDDLATCCNMVDKLKAGGKSYKECEELVTKRFEENILGSWYKGKRVKSGPTDADPTIPIGRRHYRPVKGY